MKFTIALLTSTLAVAVLAAPMTDSDERRDAAPGYGKYGMSTKTDWSSGPMVSNRRLTSQLSETSRSCRRTDCSTRYYGSYGSYKPAAEAAAMADADAEAAADLAALLDIANAIKAKRADYGNDGSYGKYGNYGSYNLPKYTDHGTYSRAVEDTVKEAE